MNEPIRLRIDPWAADYDGAAGRLDGEDAPGTVDPEVECAEWRAVRPATSLGDERLAFVDGVRRIDCRFVVEAGDQRIGGLFGSFAVGAVRSNGHASFERERVHHVAASGGGFALEPFTLRMGNGELVYAPESVAEDDPDAPLRALQNAMRRAEALLAPTLLPDADAVFVDGPLSSLAADGPLVGYVKRLMRSWLPAQHNRLLRELEVGERTPLFSIQGAPLDRYSWYQRIGSGREFDSAEAGVVRCECAARLGLDVARGLADLATAALPRFASDPMRDPRAPQNLLPIGALESRLRHRLGDALLIRRALERHVSTAVRSPGLRREPEALEPEQLAPEEPAATDAHQRSEPIRLDR